MLNAAQNLAARAAAKEKKNKAKDAAAKKRAREKAAKTKNSKVSPSNTAAFHYFDRRNVKAVCKEDKQRIKDACNDHPDAEKNSKESFEKATLSPKNTNATTRGLKATLKKGLAAVDHLGKAKSKYAQNDKNKWMANHCGGLWNKPGGASGPEGEKVPNTEAFKNEIKDKVEELTKATEDLEKAAKEKMFNFAEDYIKSHGKDVVEGAAEKAARRATLMRMPSANAWIARFSFWETVGTLLGNVAGAIVTNDMERQFQKVFKDVMDIGEKLGEYKDLLKGGLEDAMASTMAGVALVNPCIKARKCLLVPYKDSGKTDGSGCCPGQTGHHPLPSAMFNQYQPKPDGKKGLEKLGKRPCWSNYSHADALTICLEGTTNRATNGSHGLAHKGTSAIVDRFNGSLDMPYTKARDDIATMFAEAYGCNAKCIQAQLDDSLKDKHSCGSLNKAEVTPHSGESGGGPVISTGEND